jgi:predicted secreted hydrolase
MPSLRVVAFLAIAFCAIIIGNVRVDASVGDGAREQLVFPRDHGLHRSEPAEWWLLSGHLHTRDGRRFDYHAAFFRFELGARQQLYAADFSVLDERSGQTVSAERTVRQRTDSNVRVSGALALAIDHWRLAGHPLHDPRLESIAIRAGDFGNGIALTALPQKLPSPSPAFSGYAFTRMRAHGSVTFGGRRYAVDGLSWLDHEYELRAGGGSRVGWERFELQFDDGRDVELFAARLADGRFRIRLPDSRAIEAASHVLADGPDVPVAGMIVERDGAIRSLTLRAAALAIEGGTLWHSPHTRAGYPALWRLSIPVMRLDNSVAIAPLARDQEVVPDFGGVPFWWGAVDFAQAGPPGLPLGVGYVLLTGYATPTSL